MLCVCLLFFVVASTSLIPSTKSGCLQDVNSVVNTSNTGILIESDDWVVKKKCLAASDEMFNINGTLGYKIIWRKCNRGDLWKLTWTHDVSVLQNGKVVNLIQISQLNSDLSLDWVERSDGWVIAYLVKRENITNTGLFIHQTGECEFSIQGLQYKNGEEYIFHLIVGAIMGDIIKNQIFLQNIKFVAPGPEHLQSCNLEKLKIKNGEIVKNERMPASTPNTTTKVLLGKTITIQCNPGYGVKDLNYTTFQEIKCYKAARPRACLKINSPIFNTEMLIVGIISLISVMVILLPCLLIICYRINTPLS